GWKNYPNVYAGPMVIAEPDETHSADYYRRTTDWYGLSIDEIANLRLNMVRGQQIFHVKRDLATSRPFSASLDIVLSQRPLDTELYLEKTPKVGVVFSPIAQPMGPYAPLKRIRVVDNPKVPNKVDSVTEGDTRTHTAIFELYQAQIDIDYIQNLLSAGLLGHGNARRIVPTRWAITATDDVLGRMLSAKTKEYPEISEIQVFWNDYIGNHVEIILLPGPWTFEQLEAWCPGSFWAGYSPQPLIIQEHEGYRGRQHYAIKEGGGYYAARLAVLEHLYRIQRQATCLVIREISADYYLPVGVWEVRENVRQALSSRKETFGTLEEALKIVQSRLTIPLKKWLQMSVIYRQSTKQLRLTAFL
ncbi:MAG: hypothetical protein ACFFB3_18775, partial [Candidatus Hodarchaeota archaeon]